MLEHEQYEEIKALVRSNVDFIHDEDLRNVLTNAWLVTAINNEQIGKLRERADQATRRAEAAEQWAERARIAMARALREKR